MFFSTKKEDNIVVVALFVTKQQPRKMKGKKLPSSSHILPCVAPSNSHILPNITPSSSCILPCLNLLHFAPKPQSPQSFEVFKPFRTLAME